MSINPVPYSRFKITDVLITEDGQETYGLLKKFPFLDRSNLTDDQIDRILVDGTLAGKLDLLADKIYGDPRLHWIFTIFNQIQNPFNYPLNGQIVEYPIASIVLLQV